jgi:DNA-binding transcriptional LysR family regulator
VFDWTDARIFLVVASRGSFTAAANELRMDQTTVGRRIGALEAALEIKLVHRGRNGLSLTSEGRAMLGLARQMEEAALAIDRGIRGRDRVPSGVVRLTTVESFAAHFLGPRLGEFSRLYPMIALEIISSNEVANLTRREADLAIRLARPRQPGLIAKKIGSIAYGLYGAADYRKTHPAQLSDLSGHRVLGLDEDRDDVPEARFLRERGVQAYVHRSNSVGTLANAAAGGAGCAVLPCYLADPRPELAQLLPPSDVTSRDVWLAVHSEMSEQARIRAVVEWMTRTVAEAQSLLAGRRSGRAPVQT